MTRLLTISTALLALAWPASAAAQQTYQLGVFLPQAEFSDNAQRGAYADRIAAAMTEAAGGKAIVKGRAFARRSDLDAFLSAGKIDLLVADGIYAAATSKGTVIAYATVKGGSAGPAPALYTAGARVEDLRGKVIAIADIVSSAVTFYGNTALDGEVSPKKFFGDVRTAKDAQSALGAVKAKQAAAAFAPAGHPAGAGLKVVVKGGTLPAAVLVDLSGLPEALRKQLVVGLRGGAGKGGGLTGWREGGSKAIGLARAALGTPVVDRAMPILAPSDLTDVRPPRPRLSVSGKLPAPSVGQAALYPTLPE